MTPSDKASKSSRRERGGAGTGHGPKKPRSLPSGGIPPVAAAVLLLLLTAVAFFPVLRGGFIWDDDRYVTQNPLLTAPGGLGRIWFDIGATVQYYPLVFTTFWAEHRLWGLHPFGYHLVNLLLHGLSAVLLWRILRRLSVPGAWLAAAIFAVHPLQVESVAWVTERKNILSGFFYLAAALAYVRFDALGEPENKGPRNWPAYALAGVFFSLALFSKTVTSTLPAALLLVLWWKRRRIHLRDAVPLVPFFLLGILMGRTTAMLERTSVGAHGPDWDLSFLDRVLVAGRAVWFYLGKLIWPARLTFIYPRWEIDPGRIWQFVFPVAVLAVLGLLWWRRDRWGRGPLVAALFYGVTLFPALGFVNTYPMRYSFVADHFQYLAGIGPIVLLVALAMRLAGRLTGSGAAGTPPASARPSGSRPMSLRPAAAVAALVLLALSVLSWRQSRAYAGAETLYEETLRKNPAAWMAHNNLGVIQLDAGRLDEAEKHFEAAVAVKPDFIEALGNLGRIEVERDHPREAIPYYEKALAVRPDYAPILAHLGTAYGKAGQIDKAADAFRRAIAQRPDAPEFHIEFAKALSDNRRFDEAAKEYEAALAMNPRDEGAQNNLANVLMELGRTDEALARYREAIRLDPASPEPHINLGDTFRKLGRTEDALEEYRQAVAVAPGDARARYRLAVGLTTAGRFDEAADAFRAVLAASPGDADVATNLGIVLARAGRRDEAIAAFETALRANPQHSRARAELQRLRGAVPGNTPAP